MEYNGKMYDLKPEDVAKRYNWHISHVRRQCAQGRIPYIKINGKYQFNVEELDAALITHHSVADVADVTAIMDGENDLI